MTKLTFEKIKMPGANLGKHSRYPALLNHRAFILSPIDSWKCLDEEQGLNMGYGSSIHTLPYRWLEDYDRDEGIKEFDAVILENDYIKATFMPSLGGKMWSLYDKVMKKDLIVNNPIFRPCNLGLANAWTAGGVEFNCGKTPGHFARTCDKIFAAKYTAHDGTPALRLYDFERMTGVPYQLDVFLPNDSKSLFIRTRLYNPYDYLIPIYFYTNIAVEQKDGTRIITPTDNTYVNKLGQPIYTSKVPMINGLDTSYPTIHPECTDHFFRIPENQYKWEVNIDDEGDGLMFASTKRLKARKMFVWGMTTGGDNWQKLLTKEGGKFYTEVQGGLQDTQCGAVPFPPHTAYEWVEGYAGISMKPEEVHGDYFEAIDNINGWLDQNLPEDELNHILKDYKQDALNENTTLLFKGEPWGTLEEMRREATGKKAAAKNLNFGELEAEQKIWADFLKNGKLVCPDVKDTPVSFMVQKEWRDLLMKSVKGADKDNWYAWFNLALGYFAEKEYDVAEFMFNKSIELADSSWARHALGANLLAAGRADEGIVHLWKALELDPTDLGLAKEVIRLTYTFKYYEKCMELFDMIPKSYHDVEFLKAYKAITIIRLGKFEEGKAVLEEMANGAIPDLREGDETITTGYIYACQQLALKKGITLADNEVDVPTGIDYRMYPVSRK